MEKTIFLVAAEKSGDSHAAELVQKLEEGREPSSSYRYIGVGGAEMRAVGVETFIDIGQLSVMGFSAVFRALPRLFVLFRKIVRRVLFEKPAVLLLVDAPALNLRIAKALRRRGYRGIIAQYISPAVWAWGASRTATMAQTLDRLFVLYPFEEQWIRDFLLTAPRGVSSSAAPPSLPFEVHYTGHPAVAAFPFSERRSYCQVEGSSPTIALFPGSRHEEIRRHLPLLLSAAVELQSRLPRAQFIVSGLLRNEILTVIQKLPLSVVPERLTLLPYSEQKALMRAADLAIAKSGTVTLELALSGCPTVVCYAMSSLNRWMARWVVRPKGKLFCIANILAGGELFPELIAEQPTAQRIAQEAHHLLGDEEARAACIDGCRALREELTEPRLTLDQQLFQLLSRAESAGLLS